MDVIAKVLLTAVTLGISCGATPWLLRQINSSSSKNKSRPLVKRSVSASSVKTAPISPVASSIELVPKVAPKKPSIQVPAIPVPEKVPVSVPQPPVRTNEGNCLVENRVDDLETLISNNFVLSQKGLLDTSTFVKVNCSNTVSGRSSKMPSNWEGLFPKVLFEKREEVVEGKRIEIKTQTSEDSTKYKTTFIGSHFYEKEVVGEFTEKSLSTEETKVTEVRITSSVGSSEKIYLLFKK